MIPFNKPFLFGPEIDNIVEAAKSGVLAGDGAYTRLCQDLLESRLSASRVLLTHSCTAALEMSCLLANIGAGDEVIMPSFTFVSTANAFVLRGAIPVFVDIDEKTLNLDARKVESAVTHKTKAIVAVHYAGVACDMGQLRAIAARNGLLLIEDAAQAIGATYCGEHLGAIGDIGCLSFHETKNVISGEGGAIILRSNEFVERAEVIREKGTNRSKYFRGQVDKYTWCDIGSSFLPGEIVAAFLWAQLCNEAAITSTRMEIWARYHDSFSGLEKIGRVRRPFIPTNCTHNAHMYYLLANNLEDRTSIIRSLKELGVHAVFHYIPLHSSPAGLKYCRFEGDMSATNSVSERLFRLPLWIGVDADRVIDAVHKAVLWEGGAS